MHDVLARELAEVDERLPAAVAGELDPHRALLGAEGLGVDERAHGPGVADEARVLGALVLAEGDAVAEQGADDAADGVLTRLELGGAVLRDRDPVEDVEAVHVARHAGVEHDRRGFRVVPDVELRDRGRVADARRAAHEDDPLEVRGDLRVGAQQQCEVRLRRERDERHRRRVLEDGAAQQLDRALLDRAASGLGQHEPAEAVGAVHVGGGAGGL